MQLLPALRAGGVERGTIEIATALVEAGHRALVVSAGGPMVAELKAVGAEHHQLPIGKKSLGVLRYLPALKRLMQQADIVHARSRLPAWLGRRVWRRLRAAGNQAPRWVTTVHGMHSVSRYSAVMHSGERVICVSNTVRDFVLQHYPEVSAERLQVIQRGVDCNHWQYGWSPAESWRRDFQAAFPRAFADPDSSPTQPLRICMPGRLTRLKGHHHLLALLQDLKQRDVNVVALVVGGGGRRDDQMRAELQQAAVALGVADQVIFTGPRDDVREIMAISQLIVSLSTRAEAFGRTVLEALSLGIPVAGFNHGGVAEILNGLYPAGQVPVADRQALAEVAAQLLSCAPPVPAEHGLSLQAMQQQTLDLYTALGPS